MRQPPVGRQPLDAPHPGPLDKAAAISWRFLVVVAAVVVLGVIAQRLELLVVPLIVALLIAVVVTPAAAWLERRGLGHTFGALLVYVVVLGVIVTLFVVFTPRFLGQSTHLAGALRSSADSARSWLVNGPLNLSRERADALLAGVQRQLLGSQGPVPTGIISGATTLLKVVVGGLLALILSFFFVRDGRKLWSWILRILPVRRRDDADAVGRRAWQVLGQYILGSAFNGAVEAGIIALTLLALGTPLVLPLTLLQFAGAFFPLVGAVVAGGIAIIVTLANGGLGPAVVLLVVVILVHQLEGNILAPFVLGHAVRLHPVVVLVALTAGGILGGIVGAFVAVPVAAVLWGVLKELAQRDVIEPTGGAEVLLDEGGAEPGAPPGEQDAKGKRKPPA